MSITPERIAAVRGKARHALWQAQMNHVEGAALDRLIAFERAEAIALTNTVATYTAYTKAELERTMKAIEEAP